MSWMDALFPGSNKAALVPPAAEKPNFLAGREGEVAMGDEEPVEFQLPELEAWCPGCGGRGHVVVVPRTRPTDSDLGYNCARCCGTGRVFTPDGQRLFDFLQHAMTRMKANVPPDPSTGA